MDTGSYLYKILIFGPQAVMIEQREIKLSLQKDRITASELQSAMSQEFPALSDSLKTSRLACNHEFIDWSQPVHYQDELALIGMISGG